MSQELVTNKFENILEEIRKIKDFNFNDYNFLINKYGKVTVFQAFEHILKNTKEEHITSIIDRYYIAYISIEIDNKFLDDTAWIQLLEKYGEIKVIEYFRELLVNSNDEDKIRENYSYIYFYLMCDMRKDEQTKENNKFVSNNSLDMDYHQKNNFPLLSDEEEKNLFTLLNESMSKLKIAKRENNYFQFQDIFQVLISISKVEHKTKLYKVKDYLRQEDRKLVEDYLKLLKKINTIKKEKFIFPDMNLLTQHWMIVPGNVESLDSKFLNEQLDCIISYIEAKNTIFNSNVKLVTYFAKKYVSQNAELSDLIGEGYIGLMTAIDKFDIKRGNKFSTYASWWIKQAISRYVANSAKTIRLPVYISESVFNVERAIQRLTHDLDHTPSEEEIEKYLGISREQVINYYDYRYLNNVISLDAPVLDDDNCDTVLGDLISSDSDDPEIDFANNEMHDMIMRVLEGLSDKERNVIMKRFGFYDDKIYTLKEIGMELGVTRERVRQIEAEAIKRIRQPRRGKLIADFYNSDYYSKK